jgi:hypothetical protein
MLWIHLAHYTTQQLLDYLNNKILVFFRVLLPDAPAVIYQQKIRCNTPGSERLELLSIHGNSSFA